MAFTIARESGHTNVAHLFKRGRPPAQERGRATVVPGFLGAYPNTLFEIASGDIDAFVDAVAKLDGEEAYRALRTRFGILRASARFWPFSDGMREDHASALPVASGLFDFNRLDAY